jgi:hypothetical protein
VALNMHCIEQITGTVSATSGSKTVTGVGTQFTSELAAGVSPFPKNSVIRFEGFTDQFEKTEGKPLLFRLLILHTGNDVGEFLLKASSHFRNSFFVLFHDFLGKLLDLNITFNVSNFSFITHFPTS